MTRRTVLVLGALLVPATACGHQRSHAQALRTCVDRWNQGNMSSWGPAPVNVAFRRPVAKERASIELSPRRQCIVSIPAGGGTWTCVLVDTGAYWCPPLHEPTGPPLRNKNKNATIDRRGGLVLHSPLKGTHPTPALAWQRYPHLDGFVQPWTSTGRLRAGLRFKGKGRGGCVVVDETALSAISCLTARLRRYEACFPQWQDWRAGDLAACAGLGSTSFVRWRITGPDPDAQELRTCADRWNQGNMVGWGPTPASVGLARLRTQAGEESRCVVALAAHYKRHVYRDKTYVCMLSRVGAYVCPTNVEGSPPLRQPNAATDEHGVLTLDKPLKGTRPTPPLAWQQYPHVDGFVEPWTSRGTLRAGLRFTGQGRGGCFVVAETVTFGISCLARDGRRWDACFPQRRNWRAGDVAACGELGGIRFMRWTITGRRSGSRHADPPVLVPWHKIGDVGLGDPKGRVLREYGKEPELGYRLHDGRIQVGFDSGRVTSIWFSTRYYRTKSGFGVGRRIPAGRRWHGFVWNAWVREKPCSCWVKVGLGKRSLPATADNFLKPWFFINVRRGRVSSFYFASKFVD